jgi:DNA-binding NtrC family response regulator
VETRKADVRIITATNRDLQKEVKAGRFREDLFYRLHVFPVSIPPLRKRPEDIPELVRHFLARIAAEQGKRLRALDGTTMAQLAAFRWPGNVRQLENTVFRAVVLAEGDSIGLDEFPQIAAQSLSPNLPGTASASRSFPELPVAANAPTMVEVPPLIDFGPGDAPASAPFTEGTLSLLDTHGDVRPLEEIEAEAMRFAIAHYRGQMSEVARRLRIGRSTLYRKLEHLGLAERPGSEREEPAEAQ